MCYNYGTREITFHSNFAVAKSNLLQQGGENIMPVIVDEATFRNLLQREPLVVLPLREYEKLIETLDELMDSLELRQAIAEAEEFIPLTSSL